MGETREIGHYVTQESQDGTIKFLITLCDSSRIEAVLIPQKNTTSLCISSQVGCPLKCEFCVTGALGFKRNLTSDEIIGQVIIAKEYLGKMPDSIVFMGMGEPFLNYDNVIAAINTLHKDYKLSQKKITVSTVGFPDKISVFGKDTRAKLAISLHSPNPTIRSDIMPINNRISLQKVITACKQFPATRHRPIMFEYIMFDTINDSDNDLSLLSELVKDIPSIVNLIPFNSHSYSQLQPASQERILYFKKELMNQGIKTFIRETRGYDIDAACGMLAGKMNKIGTYKNTQAL